MVPVAFILLGFSGAITPVFHNIALQSFNTKMRAKNSLLFLALALFLGCNQSSKVQENNIKNSTESLPSQLKVTHAKKFKLSTHQDYTVVTVLNPWQGANQDYVYVLVPKGSHAPDLNDFKANASDIVQAVPIPISSIVCTSTTYIPLLDFLNETATLVGFPGPDYISSPTARALIKAGNVANMGTETSLNIEKLLALKPEALMDYAMQGENDYTKLARKAGVAVLFNADYLEETPLGRAEWIKFAGVFYDKANLADSIFNTIAAAYDSLKALAKQAAEKPTVFSGIMYGGTWFLPGGKNSGALFLEDAQGDYLWKNTSSNGSLKLSFEAVYEKAHKAAYWIGVADYRSLKELANADSRYSHFQAFEKKHVYSYNAKIGEKGGFTFFELGYARPDLVLADLIKILHPELLPTYELYFYKQLD